MKTYDTFLSIGEAASRLACTERTIFNVINRGALPITKHGRRSLIRERDFSAYVAGLPVVAMRKAAA